MHAKADTSVQFLCSQIIYCSLRFRAGDRIACIRSCRLSASRHSPRGLLQSGLAMNKAGRSGAITPQQLALLNSSEWFAALEPAIQQAVLASSQVMVLAAGKPVFHRGDPSDGIYCVLSG